MTQDLTQLTATEIAHGIRLGRFSSVEVTEQHLDRIHARNDRTNSFITVTDELARELASYADDAIASGTVFGPLHGVPVAIKDLDDVEGVRRTSGSLLFEDNVSEADAPFVERLKAAGAVIVGKTNTPEFALGTTTDNRIIGKTGAPFDPDRVAGGSSGGAAAAVGDNLVPLAQGSDTGGSIRAPASFCGVYGLKPTFGVIPKVSRPDGFAIHTPFSHHGPLTRTVEDAALMLDVMAGEHPKDPFSVPARDTYTSAINRPIDELRIAYSPDLGLYPIDPAVRATLDDAVSAFERAGATVERTDPEFGLEQDEIVDAYYTFATARWQGLLESLERQGFDPWGEHRDLLRPYFVDIVVESESPSLAEYRRANVVRTRVLDGFNELFESYDLLVSATLAVTAFEHGDEPESIDGVPIDPLRGWTLTQPYNFTGHPAASIPAGNVDGRPVGMQIAGQRHADADVIAASATFERVNPWTERN